MDALECSILQLQVSVTFLAVNWRLAAFLSYDDLT
jgi:hypothetical protein